MYSVFLGNGLLTVNSKEGLDYITKVTEDGLLWEYLSRVVNESFERYDHEAKLDKILNILENSAPISIATKIEEPSIEKPPVEEVAVSKPKVKGNALNALRKMKKTGGG